MICILINMKTSIMGQLFHKYNFFYSNSLKGCCVFALKYVQSI